MITPLDFLMIAVGLGWLLACSALAYKLVVDARRNRTKPATLTPTIVPTEVAVVDDAMTRRLNEIQQGRFGKPMQRQRIVQAQPNEDKR